MRSVPDGASVYLYTGMLDMRIGIDRLSMMIRDQVGRPASSGGYYVFFSRTRDRVKIFYWDRDGYAMWLKRLEAGTFKIEKRDGYEEVSALDLEAVLGGMELSRIKLRKNVENSLYSNA